MVFSLHEFGDYGNQVPLFVAVPEKQG